jgi:hypothetical protein
MTVLAASSVASPLAWSFRKGMSAKALPVSVEVYILRL